jgi:hypothetical protein
LCMIVYALVSDNFIYICHMIPMVVLWCELPHDGDLLGNPSVP